MMTSSRKSIPAERVNDTVVLARTARACTDDCAVACRLPARAAIRSAGRRLPRGNIPRRQEASTRADGCVLTAPVLDYQRAASRRMSRHCDGGRRRHCYEDPTTRAPARAASSVTPQAVFCRTMSSITDKRTPRLLTASADIATRAATSTCATDYCCCSVATTTCDMTRLLRRCFPCAASVPSAVRPLDSTQLRRVLGRRRGRGPPSPTAARTSASIECVALAEGGHVIGVILADREPYPRAPTMNTHR